MRPSKHSDLMLDQRLEEAFRERRYAHHKRRIGDLAAFKECMHGALFFLRLARQWKPKHTNIQHLEAAE